VGEQVALGGSPNATQGGGAASVRDRRRTSDGANGTMPGPATPTPPTPGGDPSGGQNPGQTPDGGQQQPLPGTSFPGQPGQPGIPQPPAYPGQPAYPGMPGMPGVPSSPNATPPGGTSPSSSNSSVGGGGGFVGGGGSFVGGGPVTGSQPANPGIPGQTLPGQPGPPVNSQTGGVSPYPTQPGANGMPPGFPQPGTTTGQGNAAADMIRNILTTPRPGGMPMGNAGGQTFGGGIAGVASTAEGEGVKVYNERTLYQEWEFIFDPSKQKQIPNPNGAGLGGTPAGNMNSGQSPQQGAPGMNPGTSPGMGPQTGRPFGQ